MDVKPSLGERVRELRLGRGWSKKYLSRLSGIPERTIRRIETGETPRPHDDTLQLLAGAFEIDWHELQAARDREAPDTPQTATTSPDIDETVPASAIPSDPTQTEPAVHSEPRRRFGAIRSRRVVYLVVVVVVLLMLAVFVLKSNKVTISGKVLCIDNERVVGVWVSAVNSGSNFANWYKTNSNGSEAAFRYDLPNGGAYNIHVGCGGSKQDWENTDYTEIGSGTIKDYNSHYITCQDAPLVSGHGPCYLKR